MLTNRQKYVLSDLSRQAWRLALERAGGREDDFCTEEDFRHQEVARAVAKHGLKCCDQNDYKAIEAHFLALLGRTEAAQRAQARAGTEPKRQAEAVLAENLQKFGLPMAYAESICRRQNKCSLAEAAANQIWRLVYTIRNRGSARSKRAASAPTPQAAGSYGKLTYIIKKS